MVMFVRPKKRILLFLQASSPWFFSGIMKPVGVFLFSAFLLAYTKTACSLPKTLLA